MAVKILSVAKGSISERAGFHAGDTLLSINGEDILDEIDYQALSIASHLQIELEKKDGIRTRISLYKRKNAPLGLQLDERIIMQPRVCQNHCIFCFVDQMPPNMRPTLYVKDDDWRLSLMMGNFVTLTNVSPREFDRILRRKVSPLYISVHATDPDTRIRMLRNPRAGAIMEQLRALKEAGIKFHTQVVLCPGINDGPILHQTIVDLASLYPASGSVAIVPIGLTGHRDNLFPLRLFQPEETRALLTDLELIRQHFYHTLGTRFVFPADEFYSIAGLPVPSEESYEGYPQIENGIGMLRQLEQECLEFWPGFQDGLSDRQDAVHGSSSPEASRIDSSEEYPDLLVATGISAFPYIEKLVKTYAPQQKKVKVIAVENHFFGPSVTVAGLITGQDLIGAIRNNHAEKVLISCSMLKENEDVFLDDLSVADVEAEAKIRVRVVKNHGEDFIRALWGF